MVGTLSVSLTILATGPVTQPPALVAVVPRSGCLQAAVRGAEIPQVCLKLLCLPTRETPQNKAGPGNAILLPRSF